MCFGDCEKMVARPLTIVQMLPDLITGGVERGTLEIGDFLSRSGHRSIVISNGGPMVEQLLQNGSEHISMPIGKKSPLTLLTVLQLRKIFIEQNIDIVHLRSRVPAWAGYLAVKTISQKKRPKIITTFHGFYSINAYSAIMTKGEKVIAVSNTIKDHIKEKYNVSEEKIITISRGFDASIFDPDHVSENAVLNLKEKWGLTDKASPFLMLPGRFTRIKGHSFFFSALEKIKDLSWTAVIVGDENEKPEYAAELKKEVRQRGLTGRVLFAGHCSDMPAAFKLCDITVSASIYPESFGRVAVESQAMGVPVVATDLGGSKETIVNGKTGWLIPINDSDAFAAALKSAVTDGQRCYRMGRRAKEWVNERFTTQLMCEKTIEIYKDLITSNVNG